MQLTHCFSDIPPLLLPGFTCVLLANAIWRIIMNSSKYWRKCGTFFGATWSSPTLHSARKLCELRTKCRNWAGRTDRRSSTYQMAKGPAQKISVAVVKVKEAVFNVDQVLLRMWRERSRNIENVNLIEKDDKTEAKTAAPEVVPEPKVPDFKAQEP